MSNLPFPSKQSEKQLPGRNNSYVLLSATPLNDRSPDPAGGIQPGTPPGAPQWVLDLSNKLNGWIVCLNFQLQAANGAFQVGQTLSLQPISDVLAEMDADISDLVWPPTRPPYKEAGRTHARSNAFTLKSGGTMPHGYQGKVSFYTDRETSDTKAESWGFITNFSIEFQPTVPLRDAPPSSSSYYSSSSSTLREED